MDDLALLDLVVEALAVDPGIRSERLRVQVQDGVVALSGRVNAHAEKIRLARVVRRIRGVVEITTEVQVTHEGIETPGDDALCARIADGLSWTATLPPGRVKVRVRRGWVVLSGAVEWDYQRGLCEDVAGRLAGVSGIVDLLTVKPRMAAIDVEACAQRALRRNAGIRSADITARFVGGNMTLTGSVRSWHERNAVRRTIWSVPGVTRILDRMVTMPPRDER
ncbi:BON domain-containing protein [Achromobacter aloeverae]